MQSLTGAPTRIVKLDVLDDLFNDIEEVLKKGNLVVACTKRVEAGQSAAN